MAVVAVLLAVAAGSIVGLGQAVIVDSGVRPISTLIAKWLNLRVGLRLVASMPTCQRGVVQVQRVHYGTYSLAMRQAGCCSPTTVYISVFR